MDILRRVTSGGWAVVEGWLDGTQTGKPVRTRFTTWLKIRAGKIGHQIDYLESRQIDYLDYATFRRLTSPPKTP